MPSDGSRPWLGWLSPLYPVVLWHMLFDGTWLCRCKHSQEYREALRRYS
jgi:hypothetical protein